MIKKQFGFALLEVLIAALVMVVGGVAYMKLQQQGLQYSYNNAARVQGMMVAEDFIEQLRGNIAIVDNNIADKSKDFTGVIKSSGDPALENYSATVASADEIFKKQLEMIQAQAKTFSSNSALCFRVKQDGFVRVDYLWLDNSLESKDKELICPSKFNYQVKDNTKVNFNNKVTIYAQL